MSESELSINKYQRLALSSAMYPKVGTGHIEAVSYTALGLAGEAGEVANKVKKVLRGDKPLTDEVKKQIVKEVGGVLWYAAALAHELDYFLEEIAALNIEELQSRKARGTLQGDGDNR